jgi:hypothetical protein
MSITILGAIVAGTVAASAAIGAIVWGMVTVAIVAAIAIARIAKARGTFGTALGALAVTTFAFGLWLRTIGIRVGATLRYFGPGIREVPRNFRHTLFVIDIRHSPELMPGISTTVSGDAPYTSHYIFRLFQEETTWLLKVSAILVFLIFFIPAYLYRLSIKSTCWVYLPLVYVVSDRNFVYQIESRKEWGRRLLAVVTLAGFILTTFVTDLTAELPKVLSSKFVSPLEF